MLVLAFDTATPEASRRAPAATASCSASGRRAPRRVLADADALLSRRRPRPAPTRRARRRHRPRAFTGLRVGLAAARGLGIALGIPAAGVSTLAALAAGAPGALPVIDARRGEVFVADPSRASARRTTSARGRAGAASATAPSATGPVLEAAGADVPPDGDERHRIRARFHAASRREFGPADALEPLYLRVPDATSAA